MLKLTSIINRNIKPQTLLSTLWLFVLLNMIFRDLHQLGKKIFLEELLTGVVNGIKITDELLLFGGLLAELPIMMVLFSRILNNKTNKWMNIIVSVITLLILTSSIPSVDMDDVFFMTIEVIAIISIIRISWKLPILKTNTQNTFNKI